MSQIVRELSGCLANLSRRERLVLELMAGVGVPRAFNLRQLAAALHTHPLMIVRLERTATARLETVARTSSCARPTTSVATLQLASFTAVAPEGGVEAASGGVAGVRYAKAPSAPGYSAKRAVRGASLATIPASHADVTLFVLFAALLATLGIGLLSADALGTGPRSSRWRAGWLAAPRRAVRRRRRR